MARAVEGPWFRESKNTWYVTVNGQSVSLRVRGFLSKAEAWKAWHRLMAGGDVVKVGDTPPSPTPTPPAPANGFSAAGGTPGPAGSGIGTPPSPGRWMTGIGPSGTTR